MFDQELPARSPAWHWPCDDCHQEPVEVRYGRSWLCAGCTALRLRVGAALAGNVPAAPLPRPQRDADERRAAEDRLDAWQRQCRRRRD